MSVLKLEPGSSCKKDAMVGIGIDIGGTQTKIGLVDVHRKLIASETIDTKEGDEKLSQVVQSYIGKLGTGIINIVNIFRPQFVILGGGISAQGEILLEPLRAMMKVGCFGGERGGRYNKVTSVRSQYLQGIPLFFPITKTLVFCLRIIEICPGFCDFEVIR